MDEVTLLRDVRATRIPAGDELTLPSGATFAITQALGGSVTLRDPAGLYRVAADDFSALGEEAAEALSRKETPTLEGEFSEDLVWSALRQCFDPEIPVNIVDLGLIYDLKIEDVADGGHTVAVKMTLTATGCGMGPTIARDAQEKIEALPTVREASVEVVWDPQWTPHMISEEGRKVLGLS